MRNRSLVFILACLALAACGSEHDDFTVNVDPGPYRLTFSLDGSFRAPHGGDPIRIALVRTFDGMILAEDSGTVSDTLVPSFSFSTTPVMETWLNYEVHTWIDSNIGGGTPGVCDPIANDHQWSTEFLTVTNDIHFTVSYQPALMEDVCGTFP